MYEVSASAEFQAYYPASRMTTGVRLASGRAPDYFYTYDDDGDRDETFYSGVGASCRMRCISNWDCNYAVDLMNQPLRDAYGNKVRRWTGDWKNKPGNIWVTGYLEASSSDWSLIYGQIKSDCRSCSLKAEDLCVSTTDLYITGSVGPNPERMPRLHGIVGEIEFEKIEPLACRDVLGCGVTGYCPPLI